MSAESSSPPSLPRIVLVQMEVAPGRPDRNVARMLERIERHRDAEVIVFSEMCVPGYLLGDAWEIDALAADFADWSETVRGASSGLTVLFGNVAVDHRRPGEDGRLRKYNAVYVCHDGEYVRRPGLPGDLPHGVHPKTLHPNYRFFDDDRHFHSVRKLAAEHARPISDWMTPYEAPRRGGGAFRFGVQVCEDVWCRDYAGGEDGVLDTVAMWRRNGAEAVFNLSASPWTREKNEKRHRTVREVLVRSPIPFFYVNQVGAQNNGKNVLVFDGDTTAYAADGRVTGRLAPWREGELRAGGGAGSGSSAGRLAQAAGSDGMRALARTAEPPGPAAAAARAGSAPARPSAPAATGRAPVVEGPASATAAVTAGPFAPEGAAAGERAPGTDGLDAILSALTAGLRHLDDVRGAPAARFLVGVSGGIDSSLVTCLLAHALGPERVLAVNMPTRFNSEVTRNNARDLCARLGVDYLVCPIEELYERVAGVVRGARFAAGEGRYTTLVDENVQARIRGADVLAGLAAKFGAVFTNNGNKTETALGYATLYGDVSGAVAPIADLYKTEVFALARHLNERVFEREVIPPNLYDGTVVPSAELSGAQDVTKGLGDPIRYGYHDAILQQMIEYRHHLVDFMEWMRNGELFPRIRWGRADRFLEYFPAAEDWIRDLEWVERQLRVNYFKRIQAPPIIVVSRRAFGFDLREYQASEYRPRRYGALRAEVARLDLESMFRRTAA